MKKTLFTISFSLLCVSCSNFEEQMTSISKIQTTPPRKTEPFKAKSTFDCGVFFIGVSDDNIKVSNRTGSSLPTRILNYDEKNKIFQFVILGSPSFGPRLADNYKLNITTKILESSYKNSNEPHPPSISKCSDQDYKKEFQDSIRK